MEFCLYGISALEALRAQGSRTPELLAGTRADARTSLPRACGVPHLDEAEEELDMLGVTSRPVHVLVCDDTHSHTTSGVVRHICSTVSSRSFARISRHVLVPCAELCFLQLASSPESLHPARMGEALPQSIQAAGPSESFLSEVDLALIGYELCGGYRIDRSAPQGFVSAEPLMDMGSLTRFLNRASGTRGIELARRAEKLMLDNARSPAEAVLAMLLTAPRRIGGMGFKGAVLNYRVDTPDGPRYIDLGFPSAGTGVEYQGEEFHELGQVRREDRRQNMIAGAGMTIFNVWRDDLSNLEFFDKLVGELARAMGLRLRIRDDGFRHRQQMLRAWVLPPLQRYDDIVF